jgi:hypothetical protein
MENTEVEVPEVKSPSVDELAQELAKMKSTNERLLKESVEYKGKYKSLAEEIESKKKNELKSKDDYKTVAEQLENQVKEEQKRAQKFAELSAFNSIKYEVSRLCPEAYDVGDVIAKMKIESSMFNPETGEVEGVMPQVEDIKKKYPYLFKQATVPAMNNTTPGFKKEEPKSLNKMSLDEKFALLGQALRTQK